MSERPLQEVTTLYSFRGLKYCRNEGMTFVTYHMASYDHMIRVLHDLVGVGYTPMSTLSLHKK